MMAMLQHKNPARGHEIYNFGRPFLGHNNYTLSLSETCPGVENIFKKYVNFTFFYPKMNSPWSGVHKIYNFLSSYPKDGSYQIW